MKPILYLEGASGISGDMTVAALLDLGADRTKLDAALAPLAEEGLTYAVTRKSSHGLAGCDFDVTLSESVHHHGHTHRHLAEVEAVLDRLPMRETARTLGKRIFRIVAEAEAKAHGCALEEVHFHEVGALDSIADIVGAAVLADDLGIADCVVTGLSEGFGTVICAHGELPVPVPAVLNIAQAHAIPLCPTAVSGERVTPTGIAIAAALRTRATLPPAYTVRKVGIGLGKRDFGGLNCLRAMLLEEVQAPERMHMLEANLDDCSGETLAVAAEELRGFGARDVCFVPCFMKKGRPAYILKVLAEESLLPKITERIFRSTTTIGVRTYPVDRVCMERSKVTLELPFGSVEAKCCMFGDIVRCYPEYESVKRVAEVSGLSFRAAFEAAASAAETMYGTP